MMTNRLSLSDPTRQPLIHNEQHRQSTAQSVQGAQLGVSLFSGIAGAAIGGGKLGAGAGLQGLLGQGVGGFDPKMLDFERLLEKQMAIQVQMQTFSSETNISKTRHEAAMSAVRNMKP